MTGAVINDPVARAIAFLEPAGRRILDIGCGSGALTGRLAGGGALAIGLDVTAARFAPTADTLFLVARAEALPVATATVDGAVIFNALHHVPEPAMVSAVAEAARVLRPGGRLVVQEPLAEGAFFELVRLIDDETAVRAAAQRVLSGAAALGLRPQAVERLETVVLAASPEALLERIVAVEPDRAATAARRADHFRARFEATAAPTADGRFAFAQPLWLGLYERAA